MAARDIRLALDRAAALFAQRPGAGLLADKPATALWQGGARFTFADLPAAIGTDLPPQLGGEGQGVSPGWLLRAGLASCTATCIVMTAAHEGVELTALEVTARSRMDTRGILGMAETGGAPVSPAPQDVTLQVRIAAVGVSADDLLALVGRAQRRATVTAALQTPLAVTVAVEAA